MIKEKIKYAVAHHFAVDPSKIYLTHPTFFSEITPKEAVTYNDEYWHPHVDKVCTSFNTHTHKMFSNYFSYYNFMRKVTYLKHKSLYSCMFIVKHNTCKKWVRNLETKLKYSLLTKLAEPHMPLTTNKGIVNAQELLADCWG